LLATTKARKLSFYDTQAVHRIVPEQGGKSLFNANRWALIMSKRSISLTCIAESSILSHSGQAGEFSAHVGLVNVHKRRLVSGTMHSSSGAANRVNLPVFGKFLIGLGLMLAVVGILLWLLGQAGFTHVPGDFAFRKGRFTLFFPIATSIVLSLVLTVILNLLARTMR
jgi:hypothetical protein